MVDVFIPTRLCVMHQHLSDCTSRTSVNAFLLYGFRFQPCSLPLPAAFPSNVPYGHQLPKQGAPQQNTCTMRTYCKCVEQSVTNPQTITEHVANICKQSCQKRPTTASIRPRQRWQTMFIHSRRRAQKCVMLNYFQHC